MKAIHRFLALALITITPHLGAAEPTGKPQQLSSPDQVPEGMAKSDWTSIRAAYEAGRHAFQPVAGGWQARNPGQQWVTTFDGRGFVAQPADGAWQWGLELQSYGFQGQERSISGVPAVKAAGQRLTYQWTAGLQEWFVNDHRGLEHGFTVSERPAEISNFKAEISNFKAQISNPLAFTLGVRGDLRPALTADDQGVRFLDGHGATVLTYSGLKVWDADGKTLPACFETADTGLRLLVDERGARYPLTIDPIAQQAYLKAGNTGAGDHFGYPVAISGDTVVVGAMGEDSSTTGVNSTPNEGATDSGAAYVFVRSGTTWTQQAYLKASNTDAGDLFGYSAAVSGNTVVIGARSEDSSTTGVNSTPNNSGTDSGAAYVFVRSGTTWTQQAYLKASNTGVGDLFGGSSVAISGDTVVVGAIFEDSSTLGVNSTPNEGATYSGAAYVFVRSGTTWTQQAYLKASNTGADDRFGNSVAVSGDTVVVGASQEDSSTTGVGGDQNDNSATDSGAAYVFTRSGTTWTQQAYLKASNTGAGDSFGGSVSLSGDTVVVGAQSEDSSTTGVNSTSNESATDSGAAYVFNRSETTWSQQAYLKASNTGAGDVFGLVAVSGDTVVVGATLEDSSTTGVNSTPNELATDSAAAYVFTRSGTAWTQQAYLKSSNTGTGDYFGASVAVSGDTVVVGAYYEDSSTTGVNSTPNDSAPNSGAAYIFTGLGASTAPIVAAPTSAQVTTTTATLGGNVTNDGGATITARGVVFAETATNNHPQLGGTGVSNVTATGTTGLFTVDIGSLTPGTAYSFAAYATNGLGTGYSAIGSFTTLGVPNIVVEQPAGTGLTDGISSVDFGTAAVGNSAPVKTFTIRNTGSGPLSGLAVTVDGTQAGEFVAGAPGATTLTTGQSTTFTLTFTPGGPGVRNAALHLASNMTGALNPFDISLTGTGSGTVTPAFPTPATVPVTSNGFTATGLTVGPLTLGFDPPAGQVLTLVSNTSGNPIGGSFTNLAAGGTLATTYGGRDLLFRASFTGGDGNDLTLTLLAPEIAIEQPAGTDLAAGGSKSFGTVILGSPVSLVFTIRNTGAGILNGLTITKTGADQAAFDVTAAPVAPVSGPSGSTTFTVRFFPTASGAKTAVLHLANDDANENPFDLTLTGQALSPTDDTDGDGLNDAAEFQLAALGFDWQLSQPALVNTLMTNSNLAGLYTQSQVQALNVGVPLLAKNPVTGKFKLTLGLQKSADLLHFAPFPLTTPGTTINGQGKLEFEFTSPDDAAFFRVQAE
ncbi:MAG: choice-of-anchor D domain-containing protein [Verrucomicrobia bacterium]|nr:choice-of-anchor D domain-containing protein [Verrucomicrobiota bacterium]